MGRMPVKIEVLRGKCIGSGNCVNLAGTIFSQDENDGKVILIAASEMPEAAAVREAALMCPVGAILIDGEKP